MMTRKITLWLVFYLILYLPGQSQDIHFSQFGFSPVNLNPALTGVFNGDFRFGGIYRSQWEAVPIPYTTLSGSFDARLLPQSTGSNVLGAGLLFNFDRAGDSELTTINIGGSLAYSLKISQKFFMSAGALIAYSQRRFTTENLTFDQQFNGDQFVPTLPTGENFPGMSFGFIDLGAGLNWRYQQSKRTKADLGVALFHINKPAQSFFDDDDVKLARKLTLNFQGSIKITNTLDLMPGFLYQKQNTYRETVLGSSIRYHLNQSKGRETALLLGGWSRLKDALIISAGLEYKNLRLGMSYDINTSDFNVATNNRGGPEIGLLYIITKVKDPGEYNSCPIF
ncbi:MAG: PorP/SprF family type IX secretion system membrane protein [Bacteroidota bacterium]